MYSPSPMQPPAGTLPLAGSRLGTLPRLGLNISERRVLLAIGDLTFVNLALTVLLARRGQLPDELHELWDFWPWFVLLSLVWLAAGYLLDIYNLARAASPLHSLWAGGSTVWLAGAAYFLIPYVTPGLPSRRLEIALFTGVALAGVAVWRLVYATVLAQPSFERTVLVVGAGRAGRTLARTIGGRTNAPGNPLCGTGYRVLGYIDDDPAKQGQVFEQVPVIGTHADLVRLVQTLRPNDLVLAITHSEQIQPALFAEVLACRQLGVTLTTMPVLYEQVTLRVPVAHVGRNLAAVIPLERSASFRLYLGARRLLDIVGGLAGCAAWGLLAPPIWLANRIWAPGALIFRQARVGRGGRPFTLLKFRSMVMDAEQRTGAVWASDHDPRITPVGRVLRCTRLDELPQSWNILRGEMSLIGPRPERPEFVAELSQQIPYYGLRHAIRPGLTGWAQVKYRYGASVDDAQTKLEYDLYYIKYKGFFLDFVILLKTVQVVLGLRGR